VELSLGDSRFPTPLIGEKIMKKLLVMTALGMIAIVGLSANQCTGEQQQSQPSQQQPQPEQKPPAQ
jgi:hypothetical protein